MLVSRSLVRDRENAYNAHDCLSARRYFRLLKWHPCWQTAYASLIQEQEGTRRLLKVVKWSFLGLYFFLEMFTIVDACHPMPFGPLY